MMHQNTCLQPDEKSARSRRGGQHDVFAADQHRYLAETGIDARGRPWLPARREDVNVLPHVRHAGRSRLLQQQLAQLWLLGWFWLAVLADWVGEFIGTRSHQRHPPLHRVSSEIYPRLMYPSG